ncbi:hypothetical protein BSKO_03197 [Bryopsis sp. KO-2023]|nr:hypothetical protein BSKO_03197 [Bryopsis sp. KO-2023]
MRALKQPVRMACRSVHVSTSTRFIHRILAVRPHGAIQSRPCQRFFHVCHAEPSARDATPEKPIYLSDMMKFESDLVEEDEGESTAPDGEELVDRASKVLGSARQLLLEIESEEDSPQVESRRSRELPPFQDTPPRRNIRTSDKVRVEPPSPPKPMRFTPPDPPSRPEPVKFSSPEPASPPDPMKFSSPLENEPITSSSPIGYESDDSSRTREVLTAALDSISIDSPESLPPVESVSKPWESSSWEPSPWENSSADSSQEEEAEPPGLQMQKEEQSNVSPILPVMEREEPATLTMQSQSLADAFAAKSKTLPPFQRVVELTSAAQPPVRGAPAATTVMGAAQPTAALDMEDGSGVLNDGTEWERTSGEEKGENGFWKRWTTLKGVTAAGKVEWEETWWEVSDWCGLKEFGALKTGASGKGGAWRETWTEKISTDSANNEQVIERSANKWARRDDGNEWEENWGENYRSGGQVDKSADKWAREGSRVWHEKWGEWYDGSGACVKYTDKWAEALTEGGKVEWGDKWEERFGDGKGSKEGETWNIDGGGHRYQKWWGENHFGDGYVQKYGNSSSGESWDVTEYMDTYYNPIPHFGFSHAIRHSPALLEIPVLPKDDVEGGLGPGIGAL